jgi:quinol monooxygenase YgiN
MVRLTVALHAQTARAANDLLGALRFLITATRLEQGCHGCFAWADPDLTVRYVEEWLHEDDVRKRVRSDRFTSLLGVLESVPDPPEVQFEFVTRTRGLDYVEELRGEHA